MKVELPELPKPALVGGIGDYREHYTADQVREIQRAAAQAALEAAVASLKTVMIAAAEEIQAHWESHCDAEGYGPQNLMRRLEEGIPSEYGYTAGAFESLRAEVVALRKYAERYRFLRSNCECMADTPDDAIDAAIQQHKNNT